MKEEKMFPMLAKTFEGLEEILADELKAFGAQEIKVEKRAVAFKGDQEVMYRSNYASRLALRILKPLNSFKAADEKELYKKSYEMDWGKIFNLHQTFAIDTLVFNSKGFQNTMYASLRLKDAIADHFRNKYGQRPDVAKDEADIRINLHIAEDNCTISLDSSGESLHKRGYRKLEHVAPINEVLAAAMINFSGWDGTANFIDPMCGSGTLLIEAAMKMLGIPAGYFRKKYCFTNWKDFDSKLWTKIHDDMAFQQIRPVIKIKGGDMSETAVAKATENIKQAGLARYITLERSDITKFQPPRGNGILVTNPPYGERIRVKQIDELYTEIGNQLKTRFIGYTAWLISSDLEALKCIGLHPSKKIKLYNGQLECRFVKYDLYEGSRKASKSDDPDIAED